MIAKKYRLKQREVKKVLQKGKPFFSYNVVFNVFPNTLGYTRFSLIIGAKNIPNNVVRNSYRRTFYTLCADFQESHYGDIVCLVKKQTKLDTSAESYKKFRSEVRYLFEKKLGKNI